MGGGEVADEAPVDVDGCPEDVEGDAVAHAGCESSGWAVHRARRAVNSSQVAEDRITPRTSLQPPSPIGGNMYRQWSQRTSSDGAGR